MHLAYNGLVFDVIRLNNWLRERVDTDDKTTFLWWKHTIDVDVVLNREATDARWFPDYDYTKTHTDGEFSPMGTERARVDRIEAARLAKAGVWGVRPPPSKLPGGVPMTDMELRERMAMPRKKLLVWSNPGPFFGAASEFGIILEQPWGNLECDAMHGPTCTYNGAIRLNGNSMGGYSYRFETCEIPPVYGEATAWSDRDPSSPVRDVTVFKAVELPRRWFDPFKKIDMVPVSSPAMVSNRWSMTSQQNPQTHLLTRVIDGEAIFRMDILKMRRLTADELRYQFMHPIPAGYVRRPPEVILNASGNAVKYLIHDDMPPSNFPGGAKHGLISVDVVQSIDYTPGMISVMGSG